MWLLLAQSSGVASVKVLEEGPDYIRLEANASSDFASVLYLGENYDPGWATKMDGVQVANHVLANTYANAWILQVPKGTYTFEIYYGPSSAYRAMFYISIGAMILLGC